MLPNLTLPATRIPTRMNVALKRAREAAYYRARAEEYNREGVRRNQLVAGNAEARQLQSDLDVGYGHE